MNIGKNFGQLAGNHSRCPSRLYLMSYLIFVPKDFFLFIVETILGIVGVLFRTSIIWNNLPQRIKGLDTIECQEWY